MFAVIETGGKQYLIKSGDKLAIEKIVGDAGQEVTFDKVLLVGNEDGTGVKIGTPYIKNGTVTATIDMQGRNKKIRVVKYKRKVRYKKVHGHRQHVTKVTVKSIA